MPAKKHQSFYSKQYSKPPSTPPATLAPRTPAGGSGSSSNTNTATSVNDLLAHLRISQQPVETDPQNSNQSTLVSSQLSHPTRSLPPSLSALLGVTPPPPLHPRTRTGPRHHRRGIAGPPPPRSWLSAAHDRAALATARREATAKAAERSRQLRDLQLDHVLPGMTMVVGGERSLVHFALLTLARNWKWLSGYERYYLPEMRPGLKALLVAYVGLYGEEPMDRAGLEVLFPLRKGGNRKKKTEEDGDEVKKIGGEDGEGVQGNEMEGSAKETSKHSTSIPLSWEDEAEADGTSIAGEDGTDGDTAATTTSTFILPDADSDSDEDQTTHLPLCYALHPTTLSPSSLLHFLFPSPPSTTTTTTNPPSTPTTSPGRFPHLTHLSLSHPSPLLPPKTLWTFLTTLLTRLPTPLTHLSLSHWPSPPDAISVYNPFPALARTTYCLTSIDVSNWEDELLLEGFAAPGIWTYWRGLRRIVWRMGWGVSMPVLVVGGDRDGYDCRVAEWRRRKAREVQARVGEQRRKCGVKGWVEVVVE